MQTFFVVISFLCIAVSAFPEPPSPYQYNSPTSSLPSISSSVASSSFGTGLSSSAIPSGSYAAPTQYTQYGPPSQAPVIHKHVYVHVPPPEQDYAPPRKPISFPPPQKHYKIVFIKAPAPPAPTVPYIPPIQQNEEKTLVYVLVKKPDEQPDIVIPTPTPTQPSKPEVYFIRYKTQKQEAAGPYPDSIAPAPSSDYGAPSPTIPQTPSSEYGTPH